MVYIQIFQRFKVLCSFFHVVWWTLSCTCSALMPGLHTFNGTSLSSVYYVNISTHYFPFYYGAVFYFSGSLVYTKLHLNRWWRLLQEVMTVVHGGVVAWQTGGPDLDGTRLWPMFTFGTLMCFALTQVSGSRRFTTNVIYSDNAGLMFGQRRRR